MSLLDQAARTTRHYSSKARLPGLSSSNAAPLMCVHAANLVSVVDWLGGSHWAVRSLRSTNRSWGWPACPASKPWLPLCCSAALDSSVSPCCCNQTILLSDDTYSSFSWSHLT